MTAQNHAAALFEAAETLRWEDPVLWAIIRGRGNEARIGLFIGYSVNMTRKALAQLVKENKIYRAKEHPTYFLQPHHSAYPQYKAYRELYHKIEMKWLEESELRPEKELVSTKTMDEWKAAHPDKASKIARFSETLTMKQAEFLRLLGELEPGFSPLAAARAQGYTRAGYTKSALLALQGKEMVQEVTVQPSTWRLTQLGVETFNELRNKGIKPRKREQMVLDVDEL